MQEEKYSTLFSKSTKEVWVELPNVLSGVFHYGGCLLEEK